jgi:hypothetical protein
VEICVVIVEVDAIAFVVVRTLDIGCQFTIIVPYAIFKCNNQQPRFLIWKLLLL